MGKLAEASKVEPPEGVTEEVATHFQGCLSEAVARSQDWAPEDELVLRTEASVSAEMGQNVLSERAVGALVAGETPPEELQKHPVPEEKLRFVETLRSEIKRSTGELKAPVEVREAIVKRLDEEMGSGKGQLIAFPTRAQWKRGLSALTSLAAGFAVLFVTLFSSADAALANSIQWDHENCCRAVMAKQGKQAPRGVKAMLQSAYGEVPQPPVGDSWDLRMSNVCRTEDGKPMIHLLYSRVDEQGELETMSFHFIPDKFTKKENLSLSTDEVKDISKDDFAVVAWLEGEWVCTASSPDLDSQILKSEASGRV